MDVPALCDRVLATPPRCGPVRVVAVDGGAGAGKSTLAARLAAEVRPRGLTAAVVATDHLLDGWDGQFTFWDRLREQVLAPLADGRAARFDRYDWVAGRFRGHEDVPVADVVVVEGVSAAAACADRASLTVWIELGRAERERRWSRRDGMPVQPVWTRWLDAEDAYFAAHPVRADVVVEPEPDVPDVSHDGTSDGTGFAPGGAAPAVRTLASRTVFASPWMSVREDDIAYADGSTGRYGVVERPDFALVVAAERGGFWLVEQYRYPVRSRQWEFCQGGWPAGAGGTPEQLARAELAEETGLRAGTLRHLGRLFSALGYSPQAFDVFLATDLVAGRVRREASEQDMVHRWFPEDEVRAMIRDGRLADAHSIAALSLVDLHRASPRG